MTPERLRQIEDLYHATRECSESDRRALLDRADPDLRIQVESLLAQDKLEGPMDRPMASVAAKVITASQQFSPGATLGPYRIDALLGAGGMGEVYRARDTRLKRQVALKVLPVAFAADPDRMMRFKREAEVLASLNHPHIAQIYGVEERALVMEFVDGKSPKGPMPFEDAWKIASQMAEALEYAHEKGVIHRDLKPTNVKVTADGRVKLLDFGLAKALSTQAEQPTPEEAENSPTLAIRNTEAGVILGTAAYMAPEQAKGAKVDKRSDIWSWGVMLYELLTGDRLFKGSDTADTLAQVLTKEPDLERVPPQIRKLLQSCLEKDSKQRLRDIGDACRLVDGADAVPSRSRFGAMGWLAGIVAGILAATVAAVLILRWDQPRAHRLMRLTADLGAELATDSFVGPPFAISANSSQLVYVSRDSNWRTHLSLRSLDRPNSTVLDGTEGAAAPFFSPDGRSIAFFADNKLKRIPVDGGTAIVLNDAPSPLGGDWGEDGTIFFTSQLRLLSIPSAGGVARPVTELRPGEVIHRSAQLLPGARAFLFSATNTYGFISGPMSIDVQVIKTGARKALVKRAYFGRYLPTSKTSGCLLYVQGSTIFARQMDAERLELTGPAVPVLQDVPVRPQYGFAQYALTPSGNFVYVAGSDSPDRLSLFWLDSAGSLQRLPAAPAQYSLPSPSPDGSRIALLISSGATDNLSVYEWARNRMTPLTFQKGTIAAFLAWSPDGKHIAFALDAQELAGPGIYWVRADGAAGARRLLEGTKLSPYSFSPDGKHLAYTDWSHGYEIRTVALDLTNPEAPKVGKPELFLSLDRGVWVPNFSPDGRWIAYSSFESQTRPQLSVRPFHPSDQGSGARWQVSTAGLGGSSFWSRKELFYHAPDMRIYVAPYTVQGDAFVPGTPRLWSENAPPILGGAGYLGMMPDGKRFIVALPPSSAEPQTHLTILVNFGDWLRQQVSGAK